MATRAAIRQLARLLGKDEFYRRLGLDEDWQPGELSAQQVAQVQALVSEHVEDLARALAQEAVANDDVFDASSAGVYLRTGSPSSASCSARGSGRRYALASGRWPRGGVDGGWRTDKRMPHPPISLSAAPSVLRFDTTSRER